jgi:hypothetical protein
MKEIMSSTSQLYYDNTSTATVGSCFADVFLRAEEFSRFQVIEENEHIRLNQTC